MHQHRTSFRRLAFPLTWLTCPSISLLCQALSSALCLTFSRKFLRRISCASSRFRISGFCRTGRDAYLNLGCLIGDDWVCLCDRLSSSVGERGEEARMGDDESGDETLGR